MTGVAVLVRKELLEQWRTKRLVVVTVLYVAFGIMSPVFARYTQEIVKALVPAGQLPVEIPAPVVADAASQFVKNVGGTLTLVAVLLAMGLVASEKERGTAAFVLTKPASRGAFIAAKVVAVGTTLGVAMILAGAAAYIYTAMLFSAPPIPGYAAMCVLLWVSQMVIATITLLGSVLVRSAVAAAGIGLAGYIGLTIVSAFPTIGAYTPAGLGGPATALAVGTPAPDVLGPLAVNLAIAAAATLLSWTVFRRQEL